MLTSLSPRARHGLIAGCTAIGVVGLHAGAAVFLASHDPYNSDVFPPCPFLFLTGWQCPGCGGTRAAYSLFHEDLVGSWRMNPIVILAYPIVGLFAGSILTHWAGRSRWSSALQRIALGALSVVIIYNLVIRNILAGFSG